MVKDQSIITIVEDEEFNKEYRPEINLADVYMFQKAYYLTESAYQILTQYEDKLKTWANRFLGVTVILFITIIAKYISSFLSKQPVNIALWEKLVLLIALGIYGLLLIFGRCFPSKKKKLKKEIDKHFQDNKKFLGAFKKDE